MQTVYQQTVTGTRAWLRGIFQKSIFWCTYLSPVMFRYEEEIKVSAAGPRHCPEGSEQACDMLVPGQCSICRTESPVLVALAPHDSPHGKCGDMGPVVRGLWALFEHGWWEVVMAGNVREQWRQQVLEGQTGQKDF